MKNLSSFKILLFTLMSFFIFSCTTENEEQINEELTSVVNSTRVTSGGIYTLKVVMENMFVMKMLEET